MTVQLLAWDSLAQDFDLAQVSTLVEWLNLLHYRKTVFGNWKSENDSPQFFLSDEGKFNPEKELQENLNAYLKKGPQKMRGGLQLPYSCAFPARARFFQSLGIKAEKSNLGCPDYEEWKKGLNAHRVHIVFSSAYPNNPASIFGHTFLRLDPPESEMNSDLLSYSVNFAADTGGETNGAIYAARGLTGNYPGFFTVGKYYIKVNEYNNSESRDLWEYELDIPQERVDFMVDHLWELYTSSRFDYYFFDENCSYHLLSLLDVAQPHWNLTNEFYNWHRGGYTLPSQTVQKVVETPGAVKQIKFRPSKRKSLFAHYQRLTPEQSKKFAQALSSNEKPSSHQDSEILDALIAYYDYRKIEDGKSKQKFWNEKLRSTLIARSQKSDIPNSKSDLSGVEVPPPFRERPDLIHRPRKLSGAVGRTGENKDYLSIEIRQGLHDRLSSDEGFESFSHIEALSVEVTHISSLSKTFLTKILLLDTLSLSPWSSLDPKFSWGTRIAFQPGFLSEEKEGNETMVRGHLGYSVFSWSSDGRIYALLGPQGGLNSRIQSGGYLSVVGQLGWIQEWNSKLKTELYGEGIKPLTSEDLMYSGYWWTTSLAISWNLNKNYGLRVQHQFYRSLVSVRNEERKHETQLLGYLYF